MAVDWAIFDDVRAARKRLDTPATNLNQLSAGRISSAAAPVPSPGNPGAGGCLELRYGEPSFEDRLRTADAITTLSIAALPTGLKLAQGLDGKGFYFSFGGACGEGKKFYYPSGLKEIRVNSQSIDAELERKWLLDGYLAASQRTFKSVDHSSDVRSFISYSCNLARLPSATLESLIGVMHKTVQHSLDPYFRIYLADLIMARLVKSLIARKFKPGSIFVDPSEAIAIAQSVVELVRSAVSDSAQALSKLNCPVSPHNVMPLSAIPLRTNPKGFWEGALYQAARRESLLEQSLERLRSDKLLNLLPVPELLLAMADGNLNIGLKECLAGAVDPTSR